MLLETSVITAACAILFFFYGLYIALAAFFILLLVLITTRKKLKDPYQTVEVGEAAQGETAPRRGRTVGDLIDTIDHCSTLYELFLHGQKIGGPCLGTRGIDSDGKAGPFEWQSYDTVLKRYKDFGSGLIELGVEKANRIGIYAENRAEWQITAQSCNAYGFVSVSIYDTLGDEHREFIVDQSEVVAIISKRAHLKNVFEVAPNCKHLKNIIIFEDPTEEELKEAKELNLGLFSFEAVEKLGSENQHKVSPPAPEDLAIIMYTSGTTSRPKGVMLTHRNVVSVVAGVTNALRPIDENTRYLSYLPLAHILERAAESYVLFHGGRIGFFQGNMRKFPEDVAALKPTLFAGVPKVYQRIMNGVLAKLEKGGAVTRAIFFTAFWIKKKSIEYGFSASFLDFVFKKVKGALGGEVQQMLTGGAPCSAECQDFIRVCFGIPFMQGYGLTETCGGSVVSDPDMVDPLGKAGSPVCCCEIKLVDAGKYSTSNVPPQGEVCISGPSVSVGYYKMEEKTKKDFEKVGDKTWFHTGDVGQWNEDGTLSIIGRVKDIFKLDSGEYVSPGRLETIYSLSKYVANIFVYGESLRSHLIAVIVPDNAAALQWAKDNGVEVPDADDVSPPNCPESLCKNDKFRKAIVDSLLEVSKQSKLNRYEQIKNVHLSGTFWMPPTGLVTSALKNKRPVLAERFEDDLKRIYDAGFL